MFDVMNETLAFTKNEMVGIALLTCRTRAVIFNILQAKGTAIPNFAERNLERGKNAPEVEEIVSFTGVALVGGESNPAVKLFGADILMPQVARTL